MLRHRRTTSARPCRHSARHSLLQGLLVATTLVGAYAHAADWPAFRGPSADGIAPDLGLNKSWDTRPPRTLWTAPLTDGGFSGPCVADGKVFIIDHAGANDVVRALDFTAGTKLWEFAYPDAAKSRYGFTESTPLYADGRLFTFSKLGKAHCLDASTGKLLWMRDLCTEFAGKRPEWDYATSPILAGKQIIFVPGGANAAVVALDPETGKTLWQGAGDSAPGYASPRLVTIEGQQQLIAFLAEGLVGIEPTSGKRLWNFPWTVPNNQNSANPVVWGNRIFITTAWNKGSVMLDMTGGHPQVLWQSKEMQARFPSPVLVNGRLYGTRDPGQLVCLDASTGALLWKKPGFEFASTIAADGTIIVLEGKSGNLLLLDASGPEYKELGHLQSLSGPECWASPIIADGKLLVRNKASLACIDLR